MASNAPTIEEARRKAYSNAKSMLALFANTQIEHLTESLKVQQTYEENATSHERFNAWELTYLSKREFAALKKSIQNQRDVESEAELIPELNEPRAPAARTDDPKPNCVNTTPVYNSGGVLLGHIQRCSDGTAPPPDLQHFAFPPWPNGDPDTRANCRNSPGYGTGGIITHYIRICFGTQ